MYIKSEGLTKTSLFEKNLIYPADCSTMLEIKKKL